MWIPSFISLVHRCCWFLHLFFFFFCSSSSLRSFLSVFCFVFLYLVLFVAVDSVSFLSGATQLCCMCFDSHIFCVSVSLVWMLSVAYIFGVTTLTVQPNVCILYAHLTVRCRFSAFFFLTCYLSLALFLSFYLFCVLVILFYSIRFTYERVCTQTVLSSSSQSKWKWIFQAIEMSERKWTQILLFHFSVYSFCFFFVVLLFLFACWQTVVFCYTKSSLYLPARFYGLMYAWLRSYMYIDLILYSVSFYSDFIWFLVSFLVLNLWAYTIRGLSIRIVPRNL